MKLRNKLYLDRRDFLTALGTAAVGTAGAGGFCATAVADSESNDEKRKSRYRESEEVKTFYRVNRYPG
jgi:hypothetical protein